MRRLFVVSLAWARLRALAAVEHRGGQNQSDGRKEKQVKLLPLFGTDCGGLGANHTNKFNQGLSNSATDMTQQAKHHNGTGAATINNNNQQRNNFNGTTPTTANDYFNDAATTTVQQRRRCSNNDDNSGARLYHDACINNDGPRRTHQQRRIDDDGATTTTTVQQRRRRCNNDDDDATTTTTTTTTTQQQRRRQCTNVDNFSTFQSQRNERTNGSRANEPNCHSPLRVEPVTPSTMSDSAYQPRPPYL